jgi:hypothetical protein
VRHCSARRDGGAAEFLPYSIGLADSERYGENGRKVDAMTKIIFFVSASFLGQACSPGGGQVGNNGAGGTFTGAGGSQTGAGGDLFVASGGDFPILGGGTESGAGGASCGSSNYTSKLLPSNILFLVDRSGSMNCNLPPTQSSATCETTAAAQDATLPTKWSVITSSLSSALDQIALVPNASVGLTFFSNDDICGVTSTPNVELGPVTTGGPQVAALKSALANGNPKGGTPIIGAVILGFKHLHQQLQAPGNRFVVLVTDGADSCFTQYAEQGVSGDVKAQLLGTELPKALSVNIRTFVIGAPGSEPARGLLSQIAFAGGTGKDPNCDHTSDDPAPNTECHFDMTRSGDFATDLTAALQKITGQAATCDFDVPKATDGKTVDVSKLNVDYFKAGGTTEADRTGLFRDDTKLCDAGADGWQFIDAAKTKIRLCGQVCETVRSDPKANVVVSLSCAAQRIR